MSEQREINKIILHCSDSDIVAHDNIETIRQWHKAKGWKDIGYHFVITQDGVIHEGRPIENVGAHCLGENANSIGICLTGSEKFSHDQFMTLGWLLNDLCSSIETITQVKPHNFYSAEKTCPNFKLAALVYK